RARGRVRGEEEGEQTEEDVGPQPTDDRERRAGTSGIAHLDLGRALAPERLGGARELLGRLTHFLYRGLHLEEPLLALHSTLVDTPLLRDHLVDELRVRDVCRCQAERVREQTADL